jgi:hypothetical protein
MTYLGKIRLAQAARAGDPWLLGFVGEPNVELAKILKIKVNYIGGRSGDAQYTAHDLPEAPEPLLTPEQVLSVPVADVQKMIADAIAKHEADKTAKNKERMAKVRAGKAGKAA